MDSFSFSNRENIKWFLAVSVNGLLMTAVMLLNHIEWREIAYGLLICVAGGRISHFVWIPFPSPKGEDILDTVFRKDIVTKAFRLCLL